MSGLGRRFVDAGYSRPKPLILVHQRPIIEWVLKMFPDVDNVTLICRDEHLESTSMKEELRGVAHQAEIIGIEAHRKGPVYAICEAFESIRDNDAVMVSYCDYYMHWDFENFKFEVENRQCAGAIPCYTGFHPNLVPESNLYASCKVDSRGYLTAIREKFSWTEDKTLSLHSPGAYYFQSGALLKEYGSKMLSVGESRGGEYYVSLVYDLMLRDGLDIWAPSNVKHFCQWGTPRDLEEYLFWVNAIKKFQV